METTQTPGAGHNLPLGTDPTYILETLKADHGDLIKRKDDLVASVEWAPDTCDDNDTLAKMSDLIKMISALVKHCEALRSNAKAPFMSAGKTVDGFFRGISDHAEKGKTSLTKRITVYQQKIAVEERRRREEEARAAAEEARKAREEAAAAAAAAMQNGDLDSAVEADDAAVVQAEEARKRDDEAKAKAAELSRARSDFGSVSSLRTTLDFEVVDIEAIPLDILRHHIARADLEKAVRSYVKAHGNTLAGVPPLAGVRFFEKHTSVVT